MRAAFIRALTRLAERDERIFLLSADTGFHALDDFKGRFPRRFLNVGISEEAMIGLAAGLALEGFQVFAYGIAPFVTYRCLEQIRIDLCLHGLCVKIVGVGAGFTYGPEGATHHAFEDVGVLSALPHLTVLCPGDPAEAEVLTGLSVSWKGPAYIRLGKSGEPYVYKSQPDLCIGKAHCIRPGKGIAVLGTGTALPLALEVVERLLGKGIEAELWSFHTLKPFDCEAVEEVASRCALLVTIEEHGPFGGLRSRVAEVLACKGLGATLLAFSAQDQFVRHAATRDTIRLNQGLSGDAILEKVLAHWRRAVVV